VKVSLKATIATLKNKIKINMSTTVDTEMTSGPEHDTQQQQQQQQSLMELCDMEAIDLPVRHCQSVHVPLNEFQEFCKALRQSKTIKKLRLTANEFTFEPLGASRWNMLQRNLPSSIEHLDLSNASESWHRLQLFFGNPLPHLLTLDLSNNKLTSSDMNKLAGFLRGCPELQSLNFANNFVGKPGMVPLLTILPSACPKLQHVDLRGNFGAHHAHIEILEWVARSPTIQTFRLDGNSNKKLTFLLEMNRFGRRCIQYCNTIPQALWATILGASSPDMMYATLQERPDILRRG
jgi:hypothetical protein